MREKKAQEEIVGFIAIVLIISIVLVIFLAIMLRNNSPELKESKEIYQFLDSSFHYTTSCAISYEPNYLTLSELIEECKEGLSTCLNEQDPCANAQKTIKSILEASFPASQNNAIKGYEFNSIYTLSEEKKDILNIKEGNCSRSSKGAEILTSSTPGTISSSLKLCY